MKKIMWNILFFCILCVHLLACSAKHDKKVESFGTLIGGNWNIEKVVFELKDGTLEEKVHKGTFYFGRFKVNTETEASCVIDGIPDDFKFQLGGGKQGNSYPEGVSFYSMSISTPPSLSPIRDIVHSSFSIVLYSDKMILYSLRPAYIHDSRIHTIHLSR